MNFFNKVAISLLASSFAFWAKGQGVGAQNLVNIHNLNTSEISALTGTIKGSLVFNTDSNKLFVYDGSIWVSTASVDTSNLSNRINQRVRYSDTASMLVGYVRKSDTASMLSTYINSASNGLNVVGQDVRFGGSLNTATSLTQNGNAFTLITGGSPLNISGLTSGASTDSILTINTSTNRIHRVAANFLNRADSTTSSNGLTLIGKDVRLGGSLSAATSITTTGSNTLAIAGLQSGTANDSLLVADASTGVLRRISIARLNLVDSTTASNGLTLTGKDVRLGGSLSAATSITTTGSNTLAISGLQSGTVNDSLLVVDASSGVLRRISTVRLNLADSTTASNGLTMTGKDVRLGGSLSAATSITTTGSNTLAIAGLQSGTANDSLLVADASSGILRRLNTSVVGIEPFNVLGGTNKATSNTQNIYTQGDLSVGKNTGSATLDVGGRIKADSNISAPNFSSTFQNFGSTGGAVTWNMQLGATAGIRLTSNATLTITNATAGMYGLIRVTQDGTGGRAITLPAGSEVINGGGSSVTLTQTANAVDILSFFFDGTNYWWTIGNNYN